MPKQATLGAAIRMRRGQLGLTQEQLAERIGHGVRQAEVSRLESGRISLPRRERLAHIAAALDLSLGELLARSGWTGAEEAFAPLVPTLPEATPQSTSPVTADPLPTMVTSSRLRTALAAAEETRERTARILAASGQAYADVCDRCDGGWRRRAVPEPAKFARPAREHVPID